MTRPADPLLETRVRRAPRPGQGFGVAFAWGLRLTLGRPGRLLAILGLGVLVGFLLGTEGVARRGSLTLGSDMAVHDLWDALAKNLLPLVVPLAALTLVAGAFQREVAERTLVFHLVRPISRKTLYLARYLAGVVVAIPAALVPLVTTMLASGVDLPASVWLALPLIVAAGVALSGAIYMLLAAWLRFGMIAGLVYTFVIESFLAASAGSAQRLSSTYYVSSLHHGLTDSAFAERSSFVRDRLAGRTSAPDDMEGAVRSFLEARQIDWLPADQALIAILLLTTGILAVGLWHVSRKDFPLKD
jgi:hypothetical protein